MLDPVRIRILIQWIWIHNTGITMTTRPYSIVDQDPELFGQVGSGIIVLDSGSGSDLFWQENL